MAGGGRVERKAEAVVTAVARYVGDRVGKALRTGTGVANCIQESCCVHVLCVEKPDEKRPTQRAGEAVHAEVFALLTRSPERPVSPAHRGEPHDETERCLCVARGKGLGSAGVQRVSKQEHARGGRVPGPAHKISRVNMVHM